MKRKFGSCVGVSVAILTMATVFTPLTASGAGQVPKVPTRNKPATAPVRPATPGEQQTTTGMKQDSKPGARMIIASSLGVDSARQLDGATICFDYDADLELPLSEYFRENDMTYAPVVWEKTAESRASFLRYECDVLLVNAADAENELSLLDGPEEYIILPETVN